VSAKAHRRSLSPRAALGLFAGGLLVLAGLELSSRIAARLSCPASPAERAFDLYAVGESTALGEPYNRGGFSLAGLVAARLGGSREGLPIRVVNLAKGGQSIYPQARGLEDALRCRDRSRPGAALVYSGHNDAGPARGTSVLMAWERLFPRSALLEALVYRLEEKVPALRARGPEHWLFHLRRAVRACKEAGVTPVLATPVSDPRFDPGLQEPGTEPAALAPLASVPCAELEALAASAGPRRRPYLVWRRGRCAEAAGERAAALRFYKEAADGSTAASFGRASTAQLAALRRLAAEEGASLADVEADFEGKPGLFADVQHPSMEGYLLLSAAYVRALGAEPAPMTAQGAFEAFGCGADCRAQALSQAGWFFLAVSVGEAAPAPRLAAARERFLQALALDRDLYPARLGLALAQSPELLSKPGSLEALGRHGVFFGRAGELDADARAELAALLGREP
jgi:hypothetical protein